jgi:hypothetical protein
MQEHIKRLAEEAGAYLDIDYPDTIRHVSITPDQLTAVAQAVARECAQIARETVCDTHIPTGVKIYGTAAAKAIRDRFGIS